MNIKAILKLILRGVVLSLNPPMLARHISAFEHLLVRVTACLYGSRKGILILVRGVRRLRIYIVEVLFLVSVLYFSVLHESHKSPTCTIKLKSVICSLKFPYTTNKDKVDETELGLCGWARLPLLLLLPILPKIISCYQFSYLLILVYLLYQIWYLLNYVVVDCQREDETSFFNEVLREYECAELSLYFFYFTCRVVRVRNKN